MLGIISQLNHYDYRSLRSWRNCFCTSESFGGKAAILEETADLGFKVSPAHSPHGLTASLLKLSRVRLDRENCIGKETIMCSRQCYSCPLIQYIAVSYFTAEMHNQIKSSTVNTYRTN